jgi:hypothetical protein
MYASDFGKLKAFIIEQTGTDENEVVPGINAKYHNYEK